MIRTLQNRVVLYTTLAALLIFALLMGLVNFLNYYRITSESALTMELLLENGGQMPRVKKDLDGQVEYPETSFDPFDLNKPDRPDGDSLAQELTQLFHSPNMETPYKTRYFSVRFDTSGNLSIVNTGQIAAVSTEQAVAMAKRLQEKGQISGYTDRYRYKALHTEDGTLYAFLDCSNTIEDAVQLLLISLVVAMMGTLFVYVLMRMFAPRIVRPIAESYEKQKQFISDAGHELKTPLAVIDACVDVLELETGETKWSQGIRRETGHLSSLTAELISLARLEETELAMVAVDLSAMLTDAASTFEPVASQQEKTITAQLPPHISLQGNPEKLEELFRLLLDNAVKYAPSGSEIRLALAKKGRHTIITVENPAENLPETDLTRLFDRFYRGDPARSSQTPGYGIGLSTARAIVQAHGGSITAESPAENRFLITVTF